jgi:adenylylsulfate reductase subunit B
MSIHIRSDLCIKCGACAHSCPGDLIDFDTLKGATMKDYNRCWGCTACMKKCPKQAIELRSMNGYPDTVQSTSRMVADTTEDKVIWTITKRDGTKVIIETVKSESNHY